MADQEDHTPVPRRRRHSDTDTWTRSVIIGIDSDLLPQVGGSRLSSDSQTLLLQSPTGSEALSVPSRAVPQNYDTADDWERAHQYTRPSISRSRSDGDVYSLPGRRGAVGSPNGSESGLQFQLPSPRSSGRSDLSPLSPWSPGGPGSLPVVPEEEEEGHLSSTDRKSRAGKTHPGSTDSCSEDDDRCSEDEDGSQCSEEDEPEHDYEQFNAGLEELRQKFRSSELGGKSKSAPPTPLAAHADSQQWKSVSPAGFSSLVSKGSSSTQSWLPRPRRGGGPILPRQHDRQPYTDEGGDSSDSNETMVPGGTDRSSRRSSRSRSKSKEPELRTLRIASRARPDPAGGEDGDADEPTDIEDELQEGL